MSSATVYCFGSYRLDPAAYRLYRGADPLELSPRGIDLLLMLAAHPGELLTKQAILDTLWRGLAVTDNALTQVISELREALGDSAAEPRFIQTVPRRGYRFIAAVTIGGPAAATRPQDAAPAPADRAARARTVAVLDFVNVTQDPDLAWLSVGAAETTTNDLRACGGVTVIDRALVAGRALTAPGTDGGSPGVDLVVAGAFQRAGGELRLTARLVDPRTGAVVAHAKADGPITDIFALQDTLVGQLASELQLAAGGAPASRRRSRETSSVEAYRALTEARLRLERLDPAELAEAVAGFERALALDPDYALAHSGLAHACFWRYQHSRADNRPDRRALEAAVAHATQAVDLDPDLAEAQATLAFVLAGVGEHGAAAAAGRRAVALEPGNWRHLFRLGMATWGSERLTALHAVIAQFPELAYAHFGAAMVHVARRDFDRAEQVVAHAVAAPALPDAVAARFPAAGLHWLLGLIRLHRGDPAAAAAAFESELKARRSPMLADEYAAEAQTGLGHVRLAGHDFSGAVQMFERVLGRYPRHARALVGLAHAWKRKGSVEKSRRALSEAEIAITEMKAGGRAVDALFATAYVQTATGDPADAVRTLSRLIPDGPRVPTGWLLPIEPLVAPLSHEPGFDRVLARLYENAR
jgi:adenylate cyclase